MHRHVETRRLKLALAITSSYFITELIAGFLTNSLALLSDAGHMLSDIGAIVLSLAAFYIARRPATLNSTYGYHRVEIVAALFNGLALWLIVGVIFTAAYNRFFEPPQVASRGMIVVAALGLAVNLASAWILYDRQQKNLNVHGAFLHVVSDAVGSIGAIVAGTVMLTTGWYLADPVVSVLIGLLVLYSSWNLVRESVSILMQWVPKGISLEEVQHTIEEVEGVEKVHDLHVWAVTSGMLTLSAHAVVDPRRDFDRVLSGIEQRLRARFNIEHTTIQLETESREDREFKAF
ncbi:MAG TPA: cation diffusion facilitator family transporter [candidate division Zixibacteria bacterium]|nr:cation diffusion facilitator family transporter [candidate division Zixibacteria bacterium]